MTGAVVKNCQPNQETGAICRTRSEVREADASLSDRRVQVATDGKHNRSYAGRWWRCFRAKQGLQICSS